MDSAPLYRDGRIECLPEGLVIRGYYFPWGGRKSIPYGRIRGAERHEMGVLSGKWRIWGTSHPRYWLNFDPGRPHKTVALVLDLGRWVRPVITPDDPEAVREIIDAHRPG
jgi:hypothetical protein